MQKFQCKKLKKLNYLNKKLTQAMNKKDLRQLTCRYDLAEFFHYYEASSMRK